LITTLADSTEVHPEALVTVKVYVPVTSPDIVVLVPVPLVVTPPEILLKSMYQFEAIRLKPRCQ